MDCDICGSNEAAGTVAKAADMSQTEPVIITVDPVPSPEVSVSSVPPLPEPLPINVLRAAIARTIKGALIIAGVLVIEGVIFSFLDPSDNHRFSLQDWSALAIALFVTGFGVTLYKPASVIASHYLIEGARSETAPAWCKQHLSNLEIALKHAIRLLFVGLFYAILMPTVSRFNELVLKTGMLTTILNVVIVIGSLIVLFLIGKKLYPLIDHFSEHVADQVAPIPVADSRHQAAPTLEFECVVQSKVCANCKTQNKAKALFCTSCGFAFVAQSKDSPPVSDQKTCPGCSTPNDCSSKFCFHCGSPIK
ncbi:MAG: hypothetical protein WCJ02_10035 [bacterium]